MDAQTRRETIAQRLRQSPTPVSASALARECSVSRQVVVGDVALLRAGGLDILATARGYILARPEPGVIRTVACAHPRENMARELELMVDHGCRVLDVVVEHPVYGQLTGQLGLSSRYDVGEFVRKVEENQALPLSALTMGVHLHTLRCPSEEAAQRVLEALAQEGVLFGASE